MKKRTATLRLTNALLKVVIAALTAVQAYCQGTFQNLNFEDGALVPIPGDPRGRVEFAPAMPGWTGYLGTNQIGWIGHNEFFFSGPGIGIMGPKDSTNGPYYVVLQTFPLGTDVPAIAQTGMIPFSAESIRFHSLLPAVTGLTVAFNGNRIPLSLLGTSTNSQSIWGGDVSSFAGQVGELRFFGRGRFDNIFFSPEVIPEPDVFGLLALGSLLLGRHFFKR